jgi:hypothetical protein
MSEVQGKGDGEVISGGSGWGADYEQIDVMHK